jgi:NitT/TauT family transport system permease protein
MNLPKLIHGKEGILFLIGVALLWQLVSSLPLKSAYLFPSPLVTLHAMWLHRAELLKGTASSFRLLLPAYLLALALGVPWGLFAGTRPWAERMFAPFARFASPIPPTVYIPYAISILPSFYLSSVFIIFIASFWPIFLNTATGAAAVPRHFRDNARVLAFTRAQYLWRLVLPASLPHIFSGMSVSLVLAFIMLTVGEAFAAHTGLGFFVQNASEYADYNGMLAGIIYTGFVVLLVMVLLDRLRRRALFWTD